MALAYSRCPVCKQPFDSCQHSVVDAENYKKNAAFRKDARKEILAILKEFNLIPKDAK